MCATGLGALQEIYLGYNHFTGSIPDCIGQFTSLLLLNIEHNTMEGSVPSSMNSLTTLQTVILSNNMFVGGLVGVWNSTMLQTVDVSNNQFSGSVPYSLFDLRSSSNTDSNGNRNSSIISFVMAKNCFTGTIAPSVCRAGAMQVLDLSGLHASCVSPVYEVYSYGVSGSIPDCIFQMPSLIALYITGNGLSGTIPQLSTSTNMIVLALDYNRLSGTIPTSIQQWSHGDGYGHD